MFWPKDDRLLLSLHSPNGLSVRCAASCNLTSCIWRIGWTVDQLPEHEKLEKSYGVHTVGV